MKEQLIPTALIDPPLNPHRVDMDSAEMSELEQSIRSIGLINPILVTANGPRYRIVAGHRRWTAHLNLQLPNIRCTVTDDDHGTGNQLQQIAENFDRSNLSPMEESLAIANLCATFNNDIPSVMKAIHRGRSFVESRLALLDLTPDLKELVHTRRLAISSALHLNQVQDKQHREYLTNHTLNGGASEHVVRAWVDQYLMNLTNHPQAAPALPPPLVEGQPVIVLMPCLICKQQHDYRQLRVQRVCDDCTHELERQQQLPAPVAASAATG
jgi:ParB/RepB/Spo0J family partition protein